MKRRQPRAKQADEGLFEAGFEQIADGVNAQALDGFSGFGTHARQGANRQRGEECRFRARFNHGESVGLMRIGGDFGDGLAGRQGNGAGQARDAGNVGFERLPQLARIRMAGL